MHLRFRYDEGEAHTYVRLFAGTDPTHLAFGGKFVLRTDEWHALRGVVESGNGNSGTSVDCVPEPRT